MKAGKWCSAQEALRTAIQPGNRVFFPIGSGQPQTLLQALADDFAYYRDVEVISGVLVAGLPIVQKGLQSSFRYISTQMSAPLRKDWEEGRIEFLPATISAVPGICGPDGPLPTDVAIIQVSPPDEHGRVTLGASTSMGFPIAKGARRIVAEVNDQAPHTYGPCSLALSEIDYLVQVSAPLVPYREIKIGEIERQIAGWVVDLIPDGATIQFGIGNLPSAILQSLKNKKDLGVHSGMLGDGIVDLVECGAVNGSRKKVFPGKLIAGELIGTEKLFRFAHKNPLVEMHPASVSHNARVIGEIDNFVSINSIIEIDLTGQINAESINDTQISGVGGAHDFAMGAAYSRGGKSFTVLTSTAAKGELSRIVPRIASVCAVTIPRYLVDYVVTEYGVAHLRGKPLA
ncbi:MAG: 4-hydroxybutyrate CoA-transferase, partial [Deltaproteobacteria bacterium]|nr:4-hydroxybutyrate CoA-transferase [Deltaproteobacteria bacterium]